MSWGYSNLTTGIGCLDYDTRAMPQVIFFIKNILKNKN
jgi:hypothetical protein